MMYDFAPFFFRKAQNGTCTNNDLCRAAAYWVQTGRCYITGKQLEAGDRELHHRLRRFDHGPDAPHNLILLSRKVHRLVHSLNTTESETLVSELALTPQQLYLVDQLRLEAHAPFLLCDLDADNTKPLASQRTA